MPGLTLSRLFYEEVVRPLLAGVPHSAALIGPGSDVLAFDTERSTDHDWGPRVLVFTRTARQAEEVEELAATRLPKEFGGYPTVFGSDANPPRHGVVAAQAQEWLTARLGFDPLGGATTLDWLAAPWQRLAEVTGGEVFHDGLDVLGRARAALAWYPDDLWRYVLACQWQRLAQEEAFPGRCGEVGDDLGSTVVTTRLVREVMRLVLLMRRRYPPYTKWLGTAFARLPGTADLGDALARAVAGTGWRRREEHLSLAYERTAALHNRLALTAPLPTTVRPYFERPFQVIDAGRFARALTATITDPRLRDLPPLGSIDQFADSTDLLCDPARCRAVTRAALGL